MLWLHVIPYIYDDFFFYTMNLKQCIVKKHAGTSVMTTEEVLELAHDKG